jgi:hypothetical protein
MLLVFLAMSGALTGLLVATLTSYAVVSGPFPSRFLKGSKEAYFLILASGVILGVCLGYFPPSGRTVVKGEPSLSDWFVYLSHLFFAIVAVAFSISGFLWDIVPDLITKPGVVIGLLTALFVPGFAGAFNVPYLPANINSLLYSAAGAAFGFMF